MSLIGDVVADATDKKLLNSSKKDNVEVAFFCLAGVIHGDMAAVTGI
jgi:hypothetical protein